MRNKIELYNYEANELIEKVLLKRNKENIFIYLDALLQTRKKFV